MRNSRSVQYCSLISRTISSRPQVSMAGVMLARLVYRELMFYRLADILLSSRVRVSPPISARIMAFEQM